MMVIVDGGTTGASVTELLRIYTKRIEERYGIKVAGKEREAYAKEASECAGYVEIDLTGLDSDSESVTELAPPIGSTASEESEPIEIDDDDEEIQKAQEKVLLAEQNLQRLQSESNPEVDYAKETKAAKQCLVNEAKESLQKARDELKMAESEEKNATAMARSALREEKAKFDDAQAELLSLKESRTRQRTAEQAERRKRARQEVGDVNMQFSQEDVIWAVDRLLIFARVAPNDAMVILRHMCRSLTPDSTLWTERDSLSQHTELESLDLAISLVKANAQQQDVQHLLRCLHLAIQFRLAARREKIGQCSGEDAAKDLVRKRNAQSYRILGMRVWFVAFSISPRNMFGVLMLPFLGLHGSALTMAKMSKLLALISLFLTTNGNGCAKRLPIPPTYAPVVDYIVERLIPAIELALIKNCERRPSSLPKDLSSLIVIREESTDERSVPYNTRQKLSTAEQFGLRMSKDTRGQKHQIEVFMPEANLIDGSFKTFTASSRSLKMVTYYDGKVRVDMSLHMKLQDKHFIVQADAEGFLSYCRFWSIPLPRDPLTAERYPGITPRPAVNVIHEHTWAAIDPRVAYWGTFTDTDSIQTDVEFFGVLNERSLSLEKTQDSTLSVATKQVEADLWVTEGSDDDNTEM